jgi:two-component system OmpR family response regulator
VLVIDDEPPVRELLCQYLASGGFEADPVGSALEADTYFRREKYALITLDFRMKGLDGAAFHKTLSKCFGYGQRVSASMPPRLPPILLITGFADDPAVQELVGKESIAGVLQKPFQRDVLLAMVKEIIAHTKERRSGRRRALARLGDRVVRH